MAKRNPLGLALEWDAMRGNGDGRVTRAKLAARIGVTRARVTQVMNLLRLHPDARKMILGLGDPLNGKVITERALRVVVKLEPAQHRETIQALLAGTRHRTKPNARGERQRSAEQ